MTTSKKIAFLFPGQGAQYVGMGKSFYDAFSCFRQTIEQASDILSCDIKKIIFSGPENVLATTKNSQPAIFIISMATLKVLEEQFPKIQPDVCAGLSLGEYSALTASNKLDFQQALLLVKKRSLWMSEACKTNPGSMSAVLGLDAKDVQEVIDSLSQQHQVWAANFNCPRQVVISGTKEGLSVVTEKLNSKGAKRVIPLKVEGAFHSGLMRKAKEKLAQEISQINIKKSYIDIVMNTSGDYVRDENEIKNYLIEQVTQSVYWEKSIHAMEKENVDVYIEIGPGQTLTNMNKKIKIKGLSFFVDNLQDLDNLSEIQ